MFPVIIMLSPAGSTPAEGWVAQGRRAAACDLVRRLGQVRSISEVFVLAADPVDREALVQLGAVPLASSTGTFHFGRSLTKIILENHFQRLGYFGGGSAPLMTENMLQEVFNRVDQMERPSALVNNYHSTDWMVVNRGDVFPRLQDRLEQDNSLGWVLAQEADFEVQAPDFYLRSSAHQPAPSR
ncbi:MAG: hypothetical protein P8Z42_06795 [Anaerolineales bacterium]